MNSHASQQPQSDTAFTYSVKENQVLVLLLALITTATLILFWPVLQWFVLKMSLANGWLHIFAFAGLSGIGLYRISQLPTLPFHTPRFVFWPTVLWVGAGFAYLINEAQVGFNTLSAVLFILFIYGLSAYFVRRKFWRSLFIPTSLLILVLPFEHYLDVYLGFPLRLLSAQWSASVLQHTGLPLLTVESILMVDNRAAIVDLDCSGIKSLWIGLIFYLLLTWVERYRIGWRWLLIGLFYLGLLVLANVARITVLVLLELVLDKPEVAGLLHQSLGLLGFGLASVVIWWVMKGVCDSASAPFSLRAALPGRSLNPWSVSPGRFRSLRGVGCSLSGVEGNIFTTALMLAVITTMNLLYQPRTTIAQVAKVRSLTLPAKYQLTPTALNAQEAAFFTGNQAQANKYHLTLTINGQPVRAAMVSVWSRAWKTHHVPENCYLSQGFSIDAQGVWNMPDHALRFLQLNRPQSSLPGTAQTAVYWFQSVSGSTPDYSARVMDNLFHPGRNWAMVSLLFETAVTPQQITPFIQTLKQAIGAQFHED